MQQVYCFVGGIIKRSCELLSDTLTHCFGVHVPAAMCCRHEYVPEEAFLNGSIEDGKVVPDAVDE